MISNNFIMVLSAGVEPALSAYKTDVLTDILRERSIYNRLNN